MKGIIAKLLVISFLSLMTVVAVGGCFLGWFLPEPLKKPVSLRDGSIRGRGMYFVGRSHYGGGFGAGK